MDFEKIFIAVYVNNIVFFRLDIKLCICIFRILEFMLFCIHIVDKTIAIK